MSEDKKGNKPQQAIGNEPPYNSINSMPPKDIDAAIECGIQLIYGSSEDGKTILPQNDRKEEGETK